LESIFGLCLEKWRRKLILKEYLRDELREFPNQKVIKEYYSNCPGNLFMKFKNLFYAKEGNYGTKGSSYGNLEMMEVKCSPREYNQILNI